MLTERQKTAAALARELHKPGIDPLKSVFFRMIGRAQGNEIVNEGKEMPELARAYGLPEHSRDGALGFCQDHAQFVPLALRTVD
jgi:hypothetical protein